MNLSPLLALLLVLLGMSGLVIVFYLLGNRLILFRKKIIKLRFAALERQLSGALSDYTCFTNTHPWVWSPCDYQTAKQTMIDACRWEKSGRSISPGGSLDFALGLEVKHQAIYIAIGTRTFDWKRLWHVEDWRDEKRTAVNPRCQEVISIGTPALSSRLSKNPERLWSVFASVIALSLAAHWIWIAVKPNPQVTGVVKSIERLCTNTACVDQLQIRLEDNRWLRLNVSSIKQVHTEDTVLLEAIPRRKKHGRNRYRYRFISKMEN